MVLLLFIVYTFWCERIALRIESVKCYLIKHTHAHGTACYACYTCIKSAAVNQHVA